jgi:hypothetical protein
MRAALSTSWCGTDPIHPEDLISGYLEVGAGRMELSYNLRPALAENLLESLQVTDIEPVSVHHPFPFPDENPDTSIYREPFNPISPLESERRAACGLMEESLRTAVRAGASAMVLHLGSVPEMDGYERELRGRLRDGGEVREAKPGITQSSPFRRSRTCG